MEDAQNSKICSDCNKDKPLSDFYSRKASNISKGDYIYYHPQCKKCSIERSWEWQKKNPEKKYEYNKKRREENPEYYKWYRDNYYNNNREKVLEDYRRWQRENRDKIREYGSSRWQNKKHEISNDEWESCKLYFNTSCAYCGMALDEHLEVFKTDLHKEHVDHDGANDLSNCVPSCKRRNSSKWTFSFSEWYDETNPFYDGERLLKIVTWLNEDYIKYLD
ncbi:HNH endonuclease [Lederbergia citrisecunda]|uniref:HNH endonuclease signature motif containing protein n=1 Tax=Lederbergia citrisecunda TaxID=2833583 RepID=UPI003D26A029